WSSEFRNAAGDLDRGHRPLCRIHRRLRRRSICPTVLRSIFWRWVHSSTDRGYTDRRYIRLLGGLSPDYTIYRDIGTYDDRERISLPVVQRGADYRGLTLLRHLVPRYRHHTRRAGFGYHTIRYLRLSLRDAALPCIW